jgi:hypothetical protein
MLVEDADLKPGSMERAESSRLHRRRQKLFRLILAARGGGEAGQVWLIPQPFGE